LKVGDAPCRAFPNFLRRSDVSSSLRRTWILFLFHLLENPNRTHFSLRSPPMFSRESYDNRDRMGVCFLSTLTPTSAHQLLGLFPSTSACAHRMLGPLPLSVPIGCLVLYLCLCSSSAMLLPFFLCLCSSSARLHDDCAMEAGLSERQRQQYAIICDTD
jgi:hypothetical protein